MVIKTRRKSDRLLATDIVYYRLKQARLRLPRVYQITNSDLYRSIPIKRHCCKYAWDIQFLDRLIKHAILVLTLMFSSTFSMKGGDSREGGIEKRGSGKGGHFLVGR